MFWWESVYARPALGDPVFESRSVEEWVEHLIGKHVNGGGGVVIVDGKLTLTKEAGVAIDEGDGLTGDWFIDTSIRRAALGLDDEDDDDDW